MLDRIIDKINRYWTFGSILASCGASFSVKYMSVIDTLGLPLIIVIGFLIFLFSLNCFLWLKNQLFKKNQENDIEINKKLSNLIIPYSYFRFETSYCNSLLFIRY